MNINNFNWKDRRVLVTGASGFKGSWLCATLLQLGAQVYGTIRNQRNPLSAYEILGLDGKVVKVNADVSDRQQVYDLVNSVEPDVIFHLAAKALVPVSLRDPRRTFEVNIMGTLNIVEACRQLKIGNRMLICSTDHVFGDIDPQKLPKGGFDEKSRVSYSGPYDTSKATMELMVRSYHKTYWSELPAIGITRCANVFGYGDTNQRRVIPLFVSSAVRDHLIPLRFRMSGRQFIHVTDAVAGYIKAASMLDEGGTNAKRGNNMPRERSPFTPTFHFAIERYEESGASNEPYIRMEKLAKLIGSQFKASIDDSHCVDYPENENKIQALNCQNTRASLQWEPKKRFADSLASLGSWYEPTITLAQLHKLVEDDLFELVTSLA